MKKKIVFILAAIFLICIIILFLPVNTYLRKAIFYGNVNIDDYKIFENRVVQAGKPQPWLISKDFNRIEIPCEYKNILKELNTVAFLVIKDTAIVHESYYDGYNNFSYSNSFSVAKSLIGLLVGCALDDGSIISLGQPVNDFFPEYNSKPNNQLTIRHVLTMSSGLNWDEQYNSAFSITTRAYYGENLRELIASRKVVTTPGKQFKYLSGNTQLLAFILEKATGKSVSEYASEKIWKPIGASQNALWSLDTKDGMEKAYCCLHTNARDFARLGQLVLNKGKWNGKQLVSEKYIEELSSPANNLIDEWGRGPLKYYGYHWWITSFRNQKVVYARGILGQYILVIPEQNMVIVRLGEKRASVRTGNLPSDLFVYLNLAYMLAGH